MRALAVLCVKNEATFLLEWLAHHRATGFTDFLVLSNDCTDGTDRMLDRLQELGQLHHLPNPGPHDGGVQWAGLKRADKHPALAGADWVMTLDIDEFVNIHLGQRQLGDLVAALPDADAIALTWRLFGNAGITDFIDAPLLDQFTMAAPSILHWPWRAAMFKTLYRNNGMYQKLGVHRPKNPDKARVDGALWRDGSGRLLPEKFQRQQIFSPFGRDNYALAQLNHYPLGAMQSYVVKADRGRAVHDADRLGMDYWVERNWNIEQDTTIAALAEKRAEYLKRWHADAQLGALHAQAVTWRRHRFESLMQQEPFRALFGRLLMTPGAQPLSIKAAQELYRFAKIGNQSQD